MPMKHFAITQRGESHIQADTPCQDFSAARSVHLPQAGCSCLLDAIADGVGSCLYSDAGARIAVTRALELLEARLPILDKIDSETVLPELRSAFHAALDAIDEYSRTERKPLLELDCTLTVAVFLEDGRLFYGHIGDDGLVVMYEDGASEMLTTRHKGQEPNSVYPLPTESMWEFGEAPKPVASIALMTDGVLDTAVGGRAHGNRVYLPMIKTALAFPMLDEEKEKQLQEHWFNHLTDPAFREKVVDDITLIVAQRAEAVAGLPEINFDHAEWNMLTAAEQQRIDQMLAEENARIQREQEERGTVTSFTELEGDEELQPRLAGSPGQEEQTETQPAQAGPGDSGPTPPENRGQPKQAEPDGPSPTPPKDRAQPKQARGEGGKPVQPVNRAVPNPSTAAASGALLKDMKDGMRRFVQDIRTAARHSATPLPAACVHKSVFGIHHRRYVTDRTLLRTAYGACCSVVDDPSVLLVFLHDDVFADQSSRTSRSAMARRLQALCMHVERRRAGEAFTHAWPYDVAFDQQGHLVGYVIDCPDSHIHLLDQVWLESGPTQYYGRWQLQDWAYTACRLAALVEQMHQKQMFVFDFDPQNFMLHKGAQPSMLRMDHICFHEQESSCYLPCSARTDMLPPEVLHAITSRTAVPCSEQTDAFSFAVLAYMLLSGGRHPFDLGDGTDVAQNILAGRSVYSARPAADMRPPVLPQELEQLFRSVFGYPLQPVRITARPDLKAWGSALNRLSRMG